MFFWLAIAIFALLSVVSIGSKCLNEFSRHRLQELTQRRAGKKRLHIITKNHERAAFAASVFQTLFISATLVTVFYSLHFSSTEFAFHSWNWLHWSFAAILAIFLLIAATIWIPTTISMLWATQIVYYLWPLWSFLMFLATPLEMIGRFCDAVFFRLAGYKPDSSEEDQFSEEIRTIVTEGHRDGLLEDRERGMIEGVIELGDVVVSEIMTPRTDICSISKNLTWDEMLRYVIKVPHSRIPVYDATRDDIIGILIAKDLLGELAKLSIEYRAPWTTLLREPYFVPETKPVASLLREFQTHHTHIVIVLDEYGGVSGITTLEDIIEEIVGEIVDEFDPDLVDGIEKVENDTFFVLGRVHIDEVNERLQIHLPEEEDYDTLAGFLLARFERVPVAGEFLDYEKIRITVLEATRRRIEKIRIEPIPIH